MKILGPLRARKEMRRRGDNYLGTEHVVLGIGRNKDGTAVRILARIAEALGMTASRLIACAEQRAARTSPVDAAFLVKRVALHSISTAVAPPTTAQSGTLPSLSRWVLRMSSSETNIPGDTESVKVRKYKTV